MRPRLEASYLMERISRLAARPPEPVQSGTGIPDRTDAALVAACVAVVAMEDRKRALFDGPGRIDDDAARDAALNPLDDELRAHLEVATRAVPATWAGHIVRASAFLLWDGGALDHQARLGSAGDQLVAAIVTDLATP